MVSALLPLRPRITSSRVVLSWEALPMVVTAPGLPVVGVLAVRLKPRVAPTMDEAWISRNPKDRTGVTL
jgi:hypothetical protein